MLEEPKESFHVRCGVRQDVASAVLYWMDSGKAMWRVRSAICS
jgi:hypothetical protein